MTEGWIKLHRKVLDNPIVTKDNDHLAVWIWLLLNASHREHPAVFNGEKITLKPGQLITGRKKLAEECRISESKANRIISEFKSEQQIEQQRFRSYPSVRPSLQCNDITHELRLDTQAFFQL